MPYTDHLNGVMLTSPFFIFCLLLNLEMFLAYQGFLHITSTMLMCYHNYNDSV